MAKHRWSILCQNVRFDGANNATLEVVLDSLQIGGLPPRAGGVVNVAFQAALVTAWRRADDAVEERFQMRVSIVGPNGQVLMQAAPMPVDLVGGLVQMRCITTIVALPVAGSGTYHFDVEQRATPNDQWHREERVPLYIEAAEAPATGEPPPTPA
jgi:hypothetical protein